MRKVLLVADGSEHSDRPVRYVAEFIKGYGPVERHLENVDPEPVAWQAHGMEEDAINPHLTRPPVICVK